MVWNISELKKKHSESLSKSGAALRKEDTESWFIGIENYVKELYNPYRIFNAHETGFALDLNSGLVLGSANI